MGAGLQCDLWVVTNGANFCWDLWQRRKWRLYTYGALASVTSRRKSKQSAGIFCTREVAESTSEALFCWYDISLSGALCLLLRLVEGFTVLPSPEGSSAKEFTVPVMLVSTLYVHLSWSSARSWILILNHQFKYVCQRMNWGIRNSGTKVIILCKRKATLLKGGSFLPSWDSFNWRCQSSISPR